MELRTRYRIYIIHYEWDGKKCVKDKSPYLYKNSGADDGDNFAYWVDCAKEIVNSIECIKKKESGVCVVLYELKPTFSYNAVNTYKIQKRKDGVLIGYKIDRKGKKKQIKTKLAIKRQKALEGRIKRAKKTYKAKKKRVIRKYQIKGFGKGCYSPDIQW